MRAGSFATSLLIAASLALTASTPAAAGPALTRADLLSADQVATTSTRSGWHRVTWDTVYSCGAFASLRTAAADTVRIAWASAEDAGGGQLAARFRSPAQAKAAYAASVRKVRDCESTQPIRVTYDMPVHAPGTARLIRLYIHPTCCGHDTHTFGFVRRHNRVSVFAIGELGETIAVAAHRRLVRAAAAQLAD